ncbi:hypothetical protein AMS68_002102 [Peltaster fructicola]|uniref:Uncharacterized protein n=1 Tax=Peltaster fructicola TaxID=286661 RepID=A0A6H0XPM5_9PEZI|nr:hypothetical protein AMS68_002102 [Peltaster fructicola]
MDSVLPDAQSVHDLLYDALFSPLCPSDTMAITQRIMECPRSKKLTKLMNKHDLTSIVEVAKQFVDAKHSKLAAKQRQLRAEKAPILPEAGPSSVGTPDPPLPVPAQSPAQLRGSTIENVRETTATTRLPDCKKEATVFEKDQLPCAIQHLILVRLQATLEAACYQFTMKVFPDIVESKEWDCVAAMELNIWSGVMKVHDARIRPYLKTIETPIEEILATLTAIRHTAVHRERVSIPTIERYLAISQMVARVLGQKSHQVAISQLQHLTTSACSHRGLHLTGSNAIIQNFDLQRANAQRQYQTTIEQLYHVQYRQQQRLTDDFARKIQADCRPGSWPLAFTGAWTYLCDQARIAAAYVLGARHMLVATASSTSVAPSKL